MDTSCVSNKRKNTSSPLENNNNKQRKGDKNAIKPLQIRIHFRNKARCVFCRCDDVQERNLFLIRTKPIVLKRDTLPLMNQDGVYQE